MQASVSLYCPPMKVNYVSGTLRQASAEPMAATISLPDGSTLTMTVTIPATIVRRQGMLRWLVDACVGKGQQDGWELTTELPQEPVVFSLSGFCMVAKAIQAPTTLLGPDGSTWKG